MNSNPIIEKNSTSNQLKPKSYLLAYLLFFTVGWLGAHRFYVGKWTTGFLYLILLYYFKFAVIFPLLVDFFLLFFIVKETREKLTEDPLYIFLKIFFSGQIKEKSLAPWAEGHHSLLSHLFDFFDNSIRVFLFLGGPIWVLMFSFYVSNSLEVSLLMVFILVFVGYIGPMNQVLNAMQNAFQRTPSLGRVPFLIDVVETVRQFYDYYYLHKPRSVIYYLFYPIIGLFSESARNEFKLYKNIIIIILVTLVLESMFSYSSIYPPYLKIGDAIGNIFVVTLLSVFTLIVALVPTVTTCFKFRFSGKRGRLAMITTLTLILMGGTFYQFNQKEMMPLVASHTIKDKMSKEAFRKALSVKTEMFLSYYYQRVTNSFNSDAVTIHSELTNLYRQQLFSLASHDEVKAFHLITIPDGNADSKSKWLGIHYESVQFDQIHPPILVLFLVSPTGEIHRSWSTVPEAIKKRFVTLDETNNIDEKTYTPNKISKYALIDEYSG